MIHKCTQIQYEKPYFFLVFVSNGVPFRKEHDGPVSSSTCSVEECGQLLRCWLHQCLGLFPDPQYLSFVSQESKLYCWLWPYWWFPSLALLKIAFYLSILRFWLVRGQFWLLVFPPGEWYANLFRAVMSWVNGIECQCLLNEHKVQPVIYEGFEFFTKSSVNLNVKTGE